MTNTNWRGPTNSMGAMEDGTTNTDDGPNYVYQGTLFPNLRGGFFNKDSNVTGRVPGFMDNPQIVVVDNIPSASTTTIVAVAAAPTSGTAMTLLTVAPGNTTAGVPSAATGVPIIPFGSSTPVTAAIALDFGFTTGTTVAASSTVNVVDNTLFTLGQWICIGGAANAAKTATLCTQVTAISTANTTTINVFPVPLGALTNAPIGAGNLFNGFLPPSTQYGPATSTANSSVNELAAGMFRVFNPVGALARNVSITGVVTTATGGNFLVSGYDIHNQAMTELLTKAASTTTVYGKKAFKYITSVVPQFTDTATYSVGIGDTFGFPVRADRAEYVNWTWGGSLMATTVGVTGAVVTPATNTSGDVRGTVQISTAGAGNAIQTSAGTSNGVLRLWVIQTLPLWNTISGTPTNTAPFFGVTQQ